jgi:hypothetical protein
MEKDGWEVFMNGRIQTFANQNEGQGRPATGEVSTVPDGNGNGFSLLGGGLDATEGAVPEYKMGTMATASDPGLVREMRIRSGFTGNVLGFGIKKKISEQTEFLGYTAVTVGIDSEQRRKFNIVRPDWRESFVRINSFWGSLTAGRQLTLFSARRHRDHLSLWLPVRSRLPGHGLQHQPEHGGQRRLRCHGRRLRRGVRLRDTGHGRAPDLPRRLRRQQRPAAAAAQPFALAPGSG